MNRCNFERLAEGQSEKQIEQRAVKIHLAAAVMEDKFWGKKCIQGHLLQAGLLIIRLTSRHQLSAVLEVMRTCGRFTTQQALPMSSRQYLCRAAHQGQQQA